MCFWMKNNWLKIAISVLVVLLILELFARFVLGLGEVPLYVESENYEYIYAPSQKVRRFGNTIITNEFSMRSLPLSSEDEIRILKFGDSVINGGSLTDHDSLASTILEKRLSMQFNKKIRVLNISAGSWGPENAFRYLQEHGDFGANIIILVYSSHDLYDNMDFTRIVGVAPSWPKHQPLCAISDGFLHYVWPQLKRIFGVKERFEIIHGIGEVNAGENRGWSHFIDYCKKNDIKLLVYLHATKSELKQRKMNENGQRIIQILKENNIDYLFGINNGISEKGYRDNIHLNNEGQKELADILFPILINSYPRHNFEFP